MVISPDIHIMNGRRELSFSLKHPLLFSIAQPVVNFPMCRQTYSGLRHDTMWYHAEIIGLVCCENCWLEA